MHSTPLHGAQDHVQSVAIGFQVSRCQALLSHPIPLKQGVGLEPVKPQGARKLIVIQGALSKKCERARLSQVGIEIWILATQFILNFLRQLQGYGHKAMIAQEMDFVPSIIAVLLPSRRNLIVAGFVPNRAVETERAGAGQDADSESLVAVGTVA